MGVDFVPYVRNFRISTETFSEDSHDVEDGCVTPGEHRLLRFDMLTYNAGDTDAELGRPEDRPDLFEHSTSHGHAHLKDFNDYKLFDESGHEVGVGKKQAFCLMDIQRMPYHPSGSGSPRFDCSYQGISAGWADVYSADLPCQYLVIDDLPDGEYTLQTTTNAEGTIGEECTGDNTDWTGLRIEDNSVSEISLPWAPEDCLRVDPDNVEAREYSIEGTPSWKVVDGNHWILDFGNDRGAAEKAVSTIQHYDLSYVCFVGRPDCPSYDPMMYWLTDDRDGPVGDMPGEDVIDFDPNNLTVTRIGQNWKVVDGSHWLLDFGPSEGNAKAALHFIQKYDFTEIGFVGRPDAEMTYFKSELSVEDVIRRPVFYPRRRDFDFEEIHGSLETPN